LFLFFFKSSNIPQFFPNRKQDFGREVAEGRSAYLTQSREVREQESLAGKST